MDDDRAYQEQQYIDGRPGGGRFSTGRILKAFFKYFAIGIIVLIYALLFWRMLSARMPAAVNKFVWTQAAIDSYESDPDAFKVYSLAIQNVNILDDGSFTVDNWRYVESVDQVQFTVRYNNSTVKYLVRDYALEDTPAGEPFIFVLTDSAGNRYTDYQYVPFAKGLYNYRNIVFYGLKLDDITSLTLNIYYAGDVNFSGSPYKNIDIYNTEYPISSFPEKGKYMTYTAYETIDDPSDPDAETSYKTYTEYIPYPLGEFDFSREIASGPTSGLVNPVSYIIK